LFESISITLLMGHLRCSTDSLSPDLVLILDCLNESVGEKLWLLRREFSSLDETRRMSHLDVSRQGYSSVSTSTVVKIMMVGLEINRENPNAKILCLSSGSRSINFHISLETSTKAYLKSRVNVITSCLSFSNNSVSLKSTIMKSCSSLII